MEMKTETDKKTILSAGHATGIASTLIGDFVNVTWRMAVPTVLFLAIGYGIGKLVGNVTAGFLSGAAIGFVIGLYLAYRLLTTVGKDEAHE